MVHLSSSMKLAEASEQFRDVFLSYSSARVFNMDFKHVWARLVGDKQSNVTMLSEFERVFHQVD